MFVLPYVFWGSLAYAQLTDSAQPKSANTPTQSCLAAAKKALGPNAEVLKCGHLTGTKGLETVAAIMLKQPSGDVDGIAVSKLVVLRRTGSVWDVALTNDKKWIRNDAGYLGIEFIDDSDQSIGYLASFSNSRSDGVAGFTIYLYYLYSNGTDDASEIEIAWNRSVGRFQEFAYDEDPMRFKAEIKNPPHVRTGKSPTQNN
jgi:hypothetical protein